MNQIPEDTYTANAPFKSNELSVLILTANNTQDLEFFYPYYRFIEEGFNVEVVTPKGGEFKGKQGMGLKNTKAIGEVDEALFDLLYIPGGKAPAELMKNDDAIALTRRFASSGRPIAAICHGPQVLAAAGVIKDHKIAAWPEVEKEVAKAGATYVNQPTVVDGQFITARWPGDLPTHLAHTLQALRDSKRAEPRLAAGKR